MEEQLWNFYEKLFRMIDFFATPIEFQSTVNEKG